MTFYVKWGKMSIKRCWECSKLFFLSKEESSTLKSLKTVFSSPSKEIPEEYDLLEKGQYVGSNIDEVAQLALLLRPWVKPNAHVLDLGSGDGRVVFTLAILWKNVYITGIEYNSALFKYSQKIKENISPELKRRVKFFKKDFLEEDFGLYDIIFYYYWGTWEEDKLVEKLNKEVKTKALLILYGHGMDKTKLEKNFLQAYKFIENPEIEPFACILVKI